MEKFRISKERRQSVADSFGMLKVRGKDLIERKREKYKKKNAQTLLEDNKFYIDSLINKKQSFKIDLDKQEDPNSDSSSNMSPVGSQ